MWVAIRPPSQRAIVTSVPSGPLAIAKSSISRRAPGSPKPSEPPVETPSRSAAATSAIPGPASHRHAQPAAAEAIDRGQLDVASARVLDRVVRHVGDGRRDVLGLDGRQPAPLRLLARRARRRGDVGVAGHAHGASRAHGRGR